MSEVEKPDELKKRGGVWFASGTAQLHLGVESDFRPAKKAHPALRCREYPALLEALTTAGITVRTDAVPLANGSPHAYVDDPFGNRIELIQE